MGGRMMRTGFLAHGNDLLGMESLHFYQNTFITETWSGSYASRTWTTTTINLDRRRPRSGRSRTEARHRLRGVR